MNLCRTCLETPADRHISELDKGIHEGNENGFDIIAYCLNINVSQDSKITTNLCGKCYRKILSYYKFKIQSQKNDAYLKCMNPVVRLEDFRNLVDQKLSVYVDENGIKHENSLDPDEFGPRLVDDAEIKVEVDIKKDEPLEEFIDDDTFQGVESDDMTPRVTQTVKYNSISDSTKENVRKKRVRVKKKPEKRHVCEECGKSVRNIKQHSRQHRPKSEQKSFPCKVCPNVYATVQGRARHYRFIHLGLKPKCEICNKVVRSLKVHHLQVHAPESLPHGCVQCGRRYVTQSALALHALSHTRDLQHQCDLCGKKFRLKHQIAKHIRQYHDKIRDFHCDFCSKSFFTKKVLQTHISSHSTQRQYKCPSCPLEFKTREVLRRHGVVHSDVKPFHCQLCPKTFKAAMNLKIHMVSHTKERRFPCRYCGVAFGRSHHRSRHEYTAHHKCYTEDKKLPTAE